MRSSYSELCAFATKKHLHFSSIQLVIIVNRLILCQMANIEITLDRPLHLRPSNESRPFQCRVFLRTTTPFGSARGSGRRLPSFCNRESVTWQHCWSTLSGSHPIFACWKASLIQEIYVWQTTHHGGHRRYECIIGYELAYVLICLPSMIIYHVIYCGITQRRYQVGSWQRHLQRISTWACWQLTIVNLTTVLFK